MTKPDFRQMAIDCLPGCVCDLVAPDCGLCNNVDDVTAALINAYTAGLEDAHEPEDTTP